MWHLFFSQQFLPHNRNRVCGFEADAHLIGANFDYFDCDPIASGRRDQNFLVPLSRQDQHGINFLSAGCGFQHVRHLLG
jgi:hypothetical protein